MKYPLTTMIIIIYIIVIFQVDDEPSGLVNLAFSIGTLFCFMKDVYQIDAERERRKDKVAEVVTYIESGRSNEYISKSTGLSEKNIELIRAEYDRRTRELERKYEEEMDKWRDDWGYD